MLEKIYFDMDQVLANFDKGVNDLCHAKTGDLNNNDDDDTEMWKAVAAYDRFYFHLDPMPGAVELFHLVYDKYGDRCEILTGIPKPRRGVVTAAEDKVAWVRKYLSEDVVVNTVNKEDKKLYAKNADCYLIDDWDVNINAWKEAGGTGIQYKSAEDVIRQLKELEVL